MSEKELLDLMQELGALHKGHFKLSSGLHSDTYFQCARILQFPELARELGGLIAADFDTPTFDVVVSPALGGILIGHEVARALDRPFLFPERGTSSELCLRRGFTLEPGEQVLIVEDVVTTGKTTEEIVTLLEESAALPVGLATIVDRSSEHAVCGMPVHALIRLSLPNYAPEDCPMCAQGLPARKPGSRRTTAQISHV